MRYKLIACQVFTRELCSAIAASPHEVDVTWLPKGLHSIDSALMRERVQFVVDGVDAHNYDAILLGYGLCNMGLAGVVARELPLVLPKAHDCITLLLGSRDRYLEQFTDEPGSYFLSSGWIERSGREEELHQLSIEKRSGLDLDHDQLVARYGADNAAYLAEVLGQTGHYRRIAFIAMGVEPDERFANEAHRRAAARGWRYDRLAGDMSLLRRLVDGDWDDDFLLVEPGCEVRASHDREIVCAEPVVNAGGPC